MGERLLEQRVVGRCVLEQRVMGERLLEQRIVGGCVLGRCQLGGGFLERRQLGCRLLGGIEPRQAPRRPRAARSARDALTGEVATRAPARPPGPGFTFLGEIGVVPQTGDATPINKAYGPLMALRPARSRGSESELQ
jgi:hypothetical protein